MAKTDTPIEDTETTPAAEVDESIVDKIMELFQSNEVAIEYGTDPQSWVEENLPEGTEAADVAGCIPEVTERLGGAYQSNAVRYNAQHGAGGQAATHSVVNEINYTYNTVYQQNAFIYAEEGSQVVNIQGDGNHVTQTQIDLDFDVEYHDQDDYEDYEHGEYPEVPDEHPVDENGDPIVDEKPDDDHDDLDPKGEEGEEVDPIEDKPWEDELPEPLEDPSGELPDDGVTDPVDDTDGWDDAPEVPTDMVDPPMPDPLGPVADAAEANPFEGAEEAML